MEHPFKRPRDATNDVTDEELRHRKARNDLRLKSAFECIFEKYGKDFAGIGDEIDLETGTIVVNNGHLANLNDEKDPGREEDHFDELDDEIWPSETRATSGQSHVRPRNITTASENSSCSGLGSEMRDRFRSPKSIDSLTGDTETGIVATEIDELAFLHRNRFLSNDEAHSPNQAARAVQDENEIDPKWHAPPLPDKVSTHQEHFETQKLLFPDASENGYMSPPGTSLWAPSKRGRKHKLARRTHTFTPITKLSGLPLSPIKPRSIRRRVASLSYECSEISINQTLDQGSVDLPAKNSKASTGICKVVNTLPWTNYEDHKLYCLKSEACVTDSRLAAAFPDRSESEIEECWLGLHLDDKIALVRGVEHHQKDEPVQSKDMSDVIDRRPPGEQISPLSVEIQPLRPSETAESQISRVKPREVGHIPATASQDHPDNSKALKAGTTVDLAIDLTFSDGEEATKIPDSGIVAENTEDATKQDQNAVSRTQGTLKRVAGKSASSKQFRERTLNKGKKAVTLSEEDDEEEEAIKTTDSETLTKNPEQISKQNNNADNRTQCILKRVTRKSAVSNKDEGRPLTTSKEDVAGTDVFTYPEIPHARQNQTLLNSVSQLVPCSEKKSRRKFITNVSTNVSAVTKVQCTDTDSTDGQRTISSDVGKSMSNPACTKCVSKTTINGPGILGDDFLCNTCNSPNSYYLRGSKRSTSQIEIDRRKNILSSNGGHAELRNRENSEDIDCLLEAQPLIITPAKVRPQTVSSTRSSTSAQRKVVKTKPIPLRTRVIDNLSDDELSMPGPSLVHQRVHPLPTVLGQSPFAYESSED